MVQGLLNQIKSVSTGHTRFSLPGSQCKSGLLEVSKKDCLHPENTMSIDIVSDRGVQCCRNSQSERISGFYGV